MRYTLHQGDNRKVLKTFADNSIDSIVTDPPYELGFMGKKWDSTGIAYDQTLWAECLRVLKPGGHLIAFGGTRTYHRMTVAIEDAGFEIRDCIQWIYGSGFPKSHDVSKAIDKQAGAEREVVGIKSDPRYLSPRTNSPNHMDRQRGIEGGHGIKNSVSHITAPATPEAQQWHGFGTALKPANEPAVLARKPLSGTVADNVMTWGVGALNIDGCRIGTEEIQGGRAGRKNASSFVSSISQEKPPIHTGRWPANVIFDKEAAQMLDAQSGVLKSGTLAPHHKLNASKNTAMSGDNQERNPRQLFGGDSGGASRFFYVAKSSRTEREAGLNAPQGERGNYHPTVKPIELMQYLVRLVTPPNGVVLDPFMGSGSTGCAAMLEKVQFIGIELNQEYVDIAEKRIRHLMSKDFIREK